MLSGSVFDFTAFCAAVDAERDRRSLSWLVGQPRQAGDTTLPCAGPDRRLRWDLLQLHEGLNRDRRERAMTWAQLAQELVCTPSRLTNLRTARMTDLELTMRITQFLRRPAADFIHPATW